MTGAGTINMYEDWNNYKQHRHAEGKVGQQVFPWSYTFEIYKP
jgi:hypothetical protein